MSAHLLLPPWIPSGVGVLAGLLLTTVKATVLLLLGLFVAGLGRRASASFRHMVLALALAGILILPPLALLPQTWRVPVPASTALGSLLAPADATRGAPQGGPAGGGPGGRAGFASGLAEPDGTAGPREAVEPGAFRQAAEATAPGRSLRAWWMALWAAGSVFFLIRFLVGLWGARRLLSGSRPAREGRVTRLARHAARKVGLPRDPEVRYSDRALVPLTWGCLRPRVVLPAAAARWSKTTLNMVLLHELAHVKRRDVLTAAAGQAATILQWFNPLLWITRRRLEAERERSADDVVLAAGIPASAYAGCLLRMARAVARSRGGPAYCVALFGKARLEERVMAIIDDRRSRSAQRPFRSALAALAALVLVAALGVAGIMARPQETAPGDAPPESVSGAERTAAENVLNAFYQALARGDEYDAIAERFLTADFFDDRWRTLERYSPAKREHLLRNTVRLYGALLGVDLERPGETRLSGLGIEGPPVRFRVEDAVQGCERIDGALRLVRTTTVEAKGPAGRRQTLARDLSYHVDFVEERGQLRIAGFGGGLAVRRMDVDTPFGPIFVVCIDDTGPQTPSGELLFKHFPRSVNPDAVRLLPLPVASPDPRG